MSLFKIMFVSTLFFSLLLTEAIAETKKKADSGLSLEEKIKTCSEILKAKFPDHLLNEKLTTKIDAVIDHRVEMAFGRVALAYLKLQAERDKGREWDAKHTGEKLVNMPKTDKELADKLFDLIEKDPPEKDIAKAKEYLLKLKEFSRHLDLKPHQYMDDSDITIMSGFLGGEADADSTEGYGKIFREMRELAVLKGGRDNKDLTKTVAKKLDGFQKTKKSYLTKAQQSILAEIKKISELSPDCKKVLTNLLISGKAKTLTQLEKDCETFIFLNSAFPDQKLKDFGNIGGNIIKFLLDEGVDQSEPDQVLTSVKRGELKCRNFTYANGKYKFDLSYSAPRKALEKWSFKDPEGNLQALSIPPQKFVKNKQGKTVLVKEGNLDIAIPSFQLSEEDLDKKLKLVSESGEDFEYLEPAKICNVPVSKKKEQSSAKDGTPSKDKAPWKDAINKDGASISGKDGVTLKEGSASDKASPPLKDAVNKEGSTKKASDWAGLNEELKKEKDFKRFYPGKEGSSGKDGVSAKDGTPGKDAAPWKDASNKDSSTKEVSNFSKYAPGRDGKDAVNGKDGTSGKDGVTLKEGSASDKASPPLKDAMNKESSTKKASDWAGLNEELKKEKDFKRFYPGKEGSSGKDGVSGKDGTPGKDAPPWKDAVNGKDGTSGKDGVTLKEGSASDKASPPLKDAVNKESSTKKASDWAGLNEELKKEKGFKRFYPGKEGSSGKDGASGKDGVSGKDGTPGKDAAPWKDASNKDSSTKEVSNFSKYAPGKDGKDAASAKDGTPGKDAPPWKDAVNGKDGTSGKDGVTLKEGSASDKASPPLKDAVNKDGSTKKASDWAGLNEELKKEKDFKRFYPKFNEAEGKTGKDGVSGKDGTPGKDAPPWKDAVNGKDGTSGKDGVTLKEGSASDKASPPLKDAVNKDGSTKKASDWAGLNEELKKEKDFKRFYPKFNEAEGKDGKDGVSGKDGTPGKDAPPWKDAVNGKDGVTLKEGSASDKASPPLKDAVNKDGSTKKASDWAGLHEELKKEKDFKRFYPKFNEAEGKDGKDGKDGASGKDGSTEKKTSNFAGLNEELKKDNHFNKLIPKDETPSKDGKNLSDRDEAIKEKNSLKLTKADPNQKSPPPPKGANTGVTKPEPEKTGPGVTTPSREVTKDSPKVDSPTVPSSPSSPKSPDSTSSSGSEASGPGIEASSCSFDLDEKGKITIQQVFITGDDSLEGASAKVGSKTTKVIKREDKIGIFDVRIGPPPMPEKVSIETAAGKKVELNLTDCSTFSDMQKLIDERKKAAEEDELNKKAAEKNADILAACDGGEGRRVTSHGFTFIACRNGVSDSERRMISNFCKGQAGEYDPTTDKVRCAPFNSVAPSPGSIPSLPPSLFNGVQGVLMKGFY